ncbi:MAG TPA: hypothetical protein VK559_01695 [Ferruginibacter sp.]|nr:hypothetical protein [Ferruginibacter sp.]
MAKAKEQKMKNNHITPKYVIKQWQVTNNQLPGVWVHDINKNKTYFSSAKKKAYSFAIEEYFYTPQINDIRINTIEKWLGNIEGTLDSFINEVMKDIKSSTENEQPKLVDIEKYKEFLLAIFSLKNRNKYDINKQKEYLTKNPDVIKRLGVGQTTDLEIAVLENLINLTNIEATEYENCEIAICKNKPGNLILCDRPFFFESYEKSISFLTLSPEFFITIKKTNTKATYTYVEADEKIVDFLNRKAAEHARHWIVAREIKTIDKYIPFILNEKQDDIPDFKTIDFPTVFYKLDKAQ